MHRIIITLIAASLLGASVSVSAQTNIVQWNFNSLVADNTTSTGVTTPSTGSGTISTVGGATSSFATGNTVTDTSTSTDNSGLNLSTWAAQGAESGLRGLQFGASTVGYTNITVSFDFRQSGTVSRFFQLQASSNGVDFSNVSGGVASLAASQNVANTGTSFSNTGLYQNNPGGGSQTFVNTLSYSFTSGSAFENNSSAAFRFVAVFDPANGSNYISANAGTTTAYSTSGTGRFDMVTISGTSAIPEPSTYATIFGVIALGGAALRRRSRK